MKFLVSLSLLKSSAKPSEALPLTAIACITRVGAAGLVLRRIVNVSSVMIARRDNVRRISNEQSPELAQIALSRRKFLGTALTGTAATLAGATLMSSLSTEPALAQSPLIPDEALKALLDGNARFASGRLSSFDKDLKVLRDRTVDKQEPYAAVLSCADSRVPVEIIFDETIGHIFIARTRS